MKLTFVCHSGFAIETDTFSVLLDYYQDSAPDPGKGYVHSHLLGQTKKLYVLASHSHPDHFCPEILTWQEKKKDICYIFSRDILKRCHTHPTHIHYLMKGEKYADQNLTVTAFGSTDIGVSFLIETADGKTIFHAGDLNNWHWRDESTAAQADKAERQFLKELALIQKAAGKVDVALFPVDPKQGTDYMRGAEQFVSAIPTGLFVPMHFWDDYPRANAFAPIAQRHGSAFFPIREKGQSILL